HRRHHALSLREDTEGDRLEHRHAAARIHLHRNQQDVPDDDGQEEVTGALTDVGNGHVQDTGDESRKHDPPRKYEDTRKTIWLRAFVSSWLYVFVSPVISRSKSCGGG